MARRGRRGRNKINATGRNDEPSERFALLRHAMLRSEAYRSLDTTARALLVEITMIENGRNNGSLWLSVKDATDRMGLTDPRPAIRAFEDLQACGLIAMTKDAHFTIKAAEASRARCWRLTWLPFDGKPATNEWMTYKTPTGSKQAKRADKGMRAMARYRKMMAAHKIPIVDFTALDTKTA